MLVHAASAASPKKAVSRAYSTTSCPLSSRAIRRSHLGIAHLASSRILLRGSAAAGPSAAAERRAYPREHRGDGVGHRRKRRSDRQRNQRHQEHVLDQVLALVIPEQPCQCPHLPAPSTSTPCAP